MLADGGGPGGVDGPDGVDELDEQPVLTSIAPANADMTAFVTTDGELLGP
jgi:hypothetical protein